MLAWTLVFLVVALIAGVFGFGVALEAAGVAQMVFGIFIALFIGSLAFGALRRR